MPLRRSRSRTAVQRQDHGVPTKLGHFAAVAPGRPARRNFQSGQQSPQARAPGAAAAAQQYHSQCRGAAAAADNNNRPADTANNEDDNEEEDPQLDALLTAMRVREQPQDPNNHNNEPRLLKEPPVRRVSRKTSYDSRISEFSDWDDEEEEDLWDDSDDNSCSDDDDGGGSISSDDDNNNNRNDTSDSD